MEDEGRGRRWGMEEMEGGGSWREKEDGGDRRRRRWRTEEAGKRETAASDGWRDGEGRIYCKKRQMSNKLGRWRGGGDGRGQGEQEEG